MDATAILATSTAVAVVLHVVAAVLSVAKIATSRRLEDRIVALDLLLAVVVAAVAVWSARTGLVAFVDVLVVGALVTFIGSILAARLLDGDDPEEGRQL
jgi:multicomponent Na+:H+ antiporter subunit F